MHLLAVKMLKSRTTNREMRRRMRVRREWTWKQMKTSGLRRTQGQRMTNLTWPITTMKVRARKDIPDN